MIPAEITPWAEALAARLAEDLVDGAPSSVLAGELRAATSSLEEAYQVLITLSRTVALVLRPTGHAGGPIGLPEAPGSPADPIWLHAAQLIGFAAQGDADMVDAIARAVLAAPHPLSHARSTLWAILEVLATEPMTPESKD